MPLSSPSSGGGAIELDVYECDLAALGGFTIPFNIVTPKIEKNFIANGSQIECVNSGRYLVNRIVTNPIAIPLSILNNGGQPRSFINTLLSYLNPGSIAPISASQVVMNLSLGAEKPPAADPVYVLTPSPAYDIVDLTTGGTINGAFDVFTGDTAPVTIQLTITKVNINV